MPNSVSSWFRALTIIIVWAHPGAIVSSFGQAAGPSQADSLSAPYSAGIVIEELNHKAAPDLGGLQEGDVLLGWSRGEDHGTLDSPFSFLELTYEQWPKGKVTLWGRRGLEERKWVLAWQYWAITVRPNFEGAALEVYLRGRRLEQSGNVAGAERTWDTLTGSHHSEIPWLSAWLKYKVALGFSRKKQLRESDHAFASAVQQSEIRLYDSATLLMTWCDEARNRGDIDLAEAKCLEALEEAQKIGHETFLHAWVLTRLSVSAREHGSVDKATEFLQEAYDLEEKLDASPNLAITPLAADALYRGDLMKAEFYYRKALADSIRHHGDANLSSSLEGLGIVAQTRGEFEAAEPYFEQALKVEQTRPTAQSNHAVSLENLGLLATDRGQFAKAEKYFFRSIREEEALGNSDAFIARNLNHLGDLARRQGNLVKAEKLLQKALSLNKQFSTNSLILAWNYSDLADVYMARGDLNRAEANYEAASAIRGKLAPGTRESAESLGALAWISRSRRQTDKASALYEQTLDVLEMQTSRLGGSSTVRASFRAKDEKYYREYADLLLSQNKPEEAFAVIERSRARTLLEMLNAAHIDVHNGADKTLLGRERSLQAAISAISHRRARLLAGQHSGEQIKAVEKEISDLTAQYQDVEAQIRATSPAYAALTQPRPLTARQIQQQLLDQDTLLLEYSLGEKRSYVFAVTPDSLHAYQLPGRRTIARQARKVHRLVAGQRKAIRGASPAQKRHRIARADIRYDRAVAELSRMILGPAAKDLTNKRLLVVTDGALAYVPFSLLPEPRASKTNRSGEAVPLIVHHEIVNLPSASVLAILREQERQRKPATRAVAVLADPVFDAHDPRVAGAMPPRPAAAAQTRSVKPGPLDGLLADNFSANLLTRSATDLGLARNGHLALPRLRFTRLEADAIMRVTPPGKGMEAVDFKANRATATGPELGHYRIVHFATHGLLNSEHPELSGLVLSLVNKKGKPQNGFLSLEDIYNLDLPADLVVLSACETGLGKEISGEGVIGLTRGFMYAGASRVVASLWKVSDVATAQLMANFYRAMEKDGLAPAAALRAAQIAMWKQRRWHRPYYWAAFQIQGEWK